MAIRSIFEVNTRLWLREQSDAMGRPLTLATVPDQALDAWRATGADAVWLMGVWQPSARGREVARAHAGLQEAYRRALADVKGSDVGASPYAVAGYTVAESLGGEAALAELRERLAQRGLKLILDFVPNHTALDHPWSELRPEFYLQAGAEEYARDPESFHIDRAGRVLACGRDPHFPAWTDTLQLNYARTDVQAAMRGVLREIAAQCDGVRCDMAMLVMPDIFNDTWASFGVQMREPFWSTAVDEVRQVHPGFTFLAEVYWDREWALQQQGFDGCYDKRLYDRLARRDIAGVREHLRAELEFQRRLVRFTENHDEARAMERFSGFHLSALLLSATAPGMVLLHEGQERGWRRSVPVQLLRRPREPSDEDTVQFHARLSEVLGHPALSDGAMEVLDVHDGVVAFLRRASTGAACTVVNLTDAPVAVRLPPRAVAVPTHWDAVRVVSTHRARMPHVEFRSVGALVQLAGFEGMCLLTR